MHTVSLVNLASSAAIYLAALALTLLIAAYCTPRHWWRRLNLRALAVTLGGTLLLGHLLAGWTGLTPALAARAESVAGAAAGAGAGAGDGANARADRTGALQAFSVHRDLNLRLAASVDAPRMLTVPAGALVTPTGMRHGDWWQISACVHGQCSTGWASSLWLRRSGE
jgi:hypothetical protein